MAQPLNILLITSDQQRWDTIGTLNGAIRTPHLDALARDGVLFERAYTVNPVCTPSRVTLLTGQYPTRHGCWHVGTSLAEDYAPTIGAAFARAGYRTGLLGKGHFRACLDPASIEAAPRIYDRDFFRSWHGPYHGFQEVRLLIGHTSEPHGSGMHYGVWLAERGVDTKRYFGIHDYRAHGAWDLPAEHHGSAFIADSTIAAIDASQRAGKPFFLWSSFQDPHCPYVVPRPWDTLHDPRALPAPPPQAVRGEGKPPFYAALGHGPYHAVVPELADHGWSDVCARPSMSAEDIRGTYAAYYGMVSLMDHHIGRIVAALQVRGLLERTVIVFTTDHGDYLGHHGLWGKGLPIYEDAQRIPFIVRAPGCAARGSRSRAPQSLIDVPVTCLALAGLEAPASMQGVSQAAAWRGGAGARDAAIVEFRPCAGGFMQWTLNDGAWKLALYDGEPYGELYDLDADPDCARNRFDDPGARAVVARMRERLEAHARSARAEDRPRARTAVA